ncbi:PcfB family protein [Parascardovia denticolens]|uniref:PcfB family protein n=1 Tax=Parascardovia denticolens TaxID=78258 RepID=UPI00248DC69A|nr:PcfB family protein [Parascardovia denticolens]
MPMEEQATQLIQEGSRKAALVGIRVTARTIQWILKTILGAGAAGLGKLDAHTQKKLNTGRMSLKRLNQITGGQIKRFDLDEKQSKQLARQLQRSGINFNLSLDKQAGTGIISYPTASAPFVQDAIHRLSPTMSSQDIQEAVMNAEQTAQALSDPAMQTVAGNLAHIRQEHVQEQTQQPPSQQPETPSPAAPSQPEQEQAGQDEQPDYWQTTPATTRQKNLIHDQAEQGLIDQQEAETFLKTNPTIAQANQWLNDHPATVDHLDLYGETNIHQTKQARKGAKLTKKEVMDSIKKGAAARTRAHGSGAAAPTHKQNLKTGISR